jgi:HD superfamily phosphodiesterase
VSGIAEWAAAYAEGLLEGLGDRWRHTMGVAERARPVGSVLDGAEREVLVAAAYLHDIGYAPALVVTGFHPIDGARHLRDLGHERLAGLVAYHSGSRYEAKARGLAEELAEFSDERSAVTKLLSYCDMTTGPVGESFTLDERLAEVERRYGPEHVVTRSLCYAARPWLESCVAWAEEALRRAEAR